MTVQDAGQYVPPRAHYRSLLQNIVSFIELFCKRDRHTGCVQGVSVSFAKELYKRDDILQKRPMHTPPRALHTHPRAQKFRDSILSRFCITCILKIIGLFCRISSLL